jgi:serine/threonine protein phosphatase PrpC
VLADDPGSAVLTLTSFGMVQRSRPGRLGAQRLVELALARGARDNVSVIVADVALRAGATGWPSALRPPRP